MGLGSGAAWVTIICGCEAGGFVVGGLAGGSGAGVFWPDVCAGAGRTGAAAGEGAFIGKGASGSGEDCAKIGAAQIKAPKPSNPDFKLRPP